MRFWDSSAIVPLLVEQPSTRNQQKLLATDPKLVVAWTTKTECYSALARLEREGFLSPGNFKKSDANLAEFSQSWIKVIPGSMLEEEAMRLLRLHNLRSADAFQLASALLASNKTSKTLNFVSLDQRLITAADKEGFIVN